MYTEAEHIIVEVIVIVIIQYGLLLMVLYICMDLWRNSVKVHLNELI